MIVSKETIDGVDRVIVDPVNFRGVITGSSGGRSWKITAPGYKFVDYNAPLSGLVTYMFGTTRRNVTLASSVSDSVGSLNGLKVAPVVRGTSRTRSFETGAAVTWATNNRRPWVLFPRESREPVENLEFLTETAGTITVEELLNNPAPLLVKHDTGSCRVPGCLLPPVRLVTVNTANHEYRGYTAGAELVAWSFDVVPGVEPGKPVPAYSWWNVREENNNWNLDGLADAGSWYDVLKG